MDFLSGGCPTWCGAECLVCRQQPGIAVAWLHFHRALQGGTRRGMLLSVDTLEVREAAQHRLVRAEIGCIPGPKYVRHGAGQNALCVGNSGNDARHEIVLQLEESIRAESALVILSELQSPCNLVCRLLL